MILSSPSDARLSHCAFALALMLSAAVPMAGLHAQGLETEGAVEAIIGSDVKTEETTVEATAERIIAAIAGTADATSAVRTRFNLGEVDIVLLTNLAEPNNPVASAIEENLEAIQALRTEIEGSAMFYHAIDSNNVILQNVIALEFDGEDVTIFAAAGNVVQ
ncbi:hypothetical protein [Shinella sp.]|uniref:hypothetical protein n=1 Tax=Shinella sp. TaxID=1870904 RepID=UPI003F725C52